MAKHLLTSGTQPPTPSTLQRIERLKRHYGLSCWVADNGKLHHVLDEIDKAAGISTLVSWRDSRMTALGCRVVAHENYIAQGGRYMFWLGNFNG